MASRGPGTALLTACTLVAFAANSLLCRLALHCGLLDPLSFTSLRLASGALVLLPLSLLAGESPGARKIEGSWVSAFALFAYAAAFSLAYVTLGTGMGALILFGAVQVTMIGAAMVAGERLRIVQWLGLTAAVGGLVYLVLPGIAAPRPLGTFLMCAAGVAWGVYSIRGRGVEAPVTMTAGNFARTVPMAVLASTAGLSFLHWQSSGILLALISGAVTSGLGYVIWYQALRGLTTAQASVVQLLVPPLAAFGGVIWLGERLTVRLIVASVLILGGVALAVVKRGPVLDDR